jgi:hypothetical protein
MMYTRQADLQKMNAELSGWWRERGAERSGA